MDFDFENFIITCIKEYFRAKGLTYKLPNITISTFKDELPIQYKLIFTFPKAGRLNEIFLFLDFQQNQGIFQKLVITEKTSELNLDFSELGEIGTSLNSIKDYLQEPLEVHYKKRYFSGY